MMGRYVLTIALLAIASSAAFAQSESRLIRESYQSEVMGTERDYFVYLPAGFENKDDWPVLLFLHGNGERGDAKDELGFVLVHGPLYEAWIQKRDLPFVIIGPQLPMYEMGDVSYIRDRTLDDIPERLEVGVPARAPKWPSDEPMDGVPAARPDRLPPEGLPSGWPLHAEELIDMVDHTIANHRGDPDRVYITGLSYGGFGTWYMASKYPDRFAAANPIVGFAHPDLIDSIAENGMPVWCFAGGRDAVIQVQYFYDAMNKLDQLSEADIRFTVEEDMAHDVWTRTYAGEDIYKWMLSYSNPR